MMMACLMGWHIWTRRCKFVFQQHKLPSGEVLLNIWFELVSWLRGRYDSIKGESDIVEKSSGKVSAEMGQFSYGG